jgi:hypothetical protein
MSALGAAIARQLATRLAGPRDAGISMTELVVTIMVTGLMAAMVSTMFINVALATNNSTSTIQRNGIATNVMDAVGTVIRTAAKNPVASSSEADPAVVAGTGTSLTVYSFVNADPANPAPTKVGYRLDASGNLLEDKWVATLSSGYWVFTGTATTRTLGGPLITPGGFDPIFVYLDDTGAMVTPGGSGLTLAQRKTITSIRITLQMANSPTTGSSNILIVSTVAMPNLTIAGAGS